MAITYINGAHHQTSNQFLIPEDIDWTILIFGRWDNVVQESIVFQVEDFSIVVKDGNITFSCSDKSINSVAITASQWYEVALSREHNTVDIRTVPMGVSVPVSDGGQVILNRRVRGKLTIAAGRIPNYTHTYNSLSDVIFVDGIRLTTVALYAVANFYMPIYNTEWYSNATMHFINTNGENRRGDNNFILTGSTNWIADPPTLSRVGHNSPIQVRHVPFIISDNLLFSGATIDYSPSHTSHPGTNLYTFKKSLTWRANQGADLHLTITWAEPVTIDSIAIPHHNMVEGSLIAITTSLDIPTQGGPPVALSELLHVSVGSDKSPPSGFQFHHSNSYPYGGGYMWGITFDPLTIRQITFEFKELISPEWFLEMSTVVLGLSSLSRLPISYGLSRRTDDKTRYNIRQSGNVHIRRGIVNEELSFNLDNMPPEDKINVLTMIKNTGTHLPVFASLQGHSLSKHERQSYMIYGYFQDTPDITIDGFKNYSSSIEIIGM